MNEHDRLNALHSLAILDTGPEPPFDELTTVASRIFGTSMALVSLIDEHRQWWKSNIGIDETETPRDIAFCDVVVRTQKPLVVPDTHEDERFASNPLVCGAPHIRFYAGVPARVDGQVVGTLCILDSAPRAFDEDDLQTLLLLGRQLEKHLEARQVQIDLVMHQAMLEELVKVIPDVVWVADGDRVTYISGGVEDLLGVSSDELDRDSLCWIANVHPDDQAGLEHAIEQSRVLHDLDHQFRIDLGSGFRWLHTRAIVLPETFETGRVAGITSDVTEQKTRMELLERVAIDRGEKLNQALLRVDAEFESSPFGMVVLDATTGKIVRVNPAAEMLFNAPEPEIVERHLHLFLESDDGERLSRWLENAQSREFRASLNGVGKVVEMFARQVTAHDSAHIHLVMQDITDHELARDELQTTRAQLLQAQKMEAFGQLAGGIAHDYNNFLAVISSCAQFIEEHLPADHEVREDVSEILNACEQATSLTRQLLVFSRTTVVEPVNVDVASKVEQMKGLLDRALPQKIALTVERNRAGVSTLTKGGIEQVLMNLVLNARDAMEADGGCVRVNSDVRWVDAVPDISPGVYNIITVTDSGKGIPADIMERMFEPFFTTKDEHKGTGLGLPTSWALVSAAGGTIVARSEPGVGTEFCVYIPAHEGSLDEATEEFSEPTWLNDRPRLLLVEDDPSVRRVMARILGGVAESVEQTDSALKALLWLDENGYDSIDVIVTDLAMPHMSGVEFIRRVRLVDATIPFVVVSANPNAFTDLSTLPGVASVITKPFESPQLVRNVLAGSRVNREKLRAGHGMPV